eukprot:CAMPEP_0197575266 /NCGR_PEP_ID=MMETSP1326-20131121/719_1 /TAXON_ID=1155430 /ORGANISM="Genus nov. species nov., Strain RCC2288" /LENGTH=267 /DNA_ID=CAMNT_0043138003 /DNA_START=175 /DNA_END=974 /DNA_ORIENTATION=+
MAMVTRTSASGAHAVSAALLLLLAVASCGVSTCRALEPLPFIEIPLYLGQQRLALGIFEGDNVNNAVEKFGVTHALTTTELTALKAEVTRRFTSIAAAVAAAPPAAAGAGPLKEPLFEIPIGMEDGRVVSLRLFEGDNLVRAVQQFAKKQNIPDDVVPSLFEEVKKRVFPNTAAASADGAAAADGSAAAGATGATPSANDGLLFDIPIDVDGVVKYLKLYRGDVLGDRVKEFAVEHKLADAAAQQMLDAVAERIRATQEAARAAEEA